MFKGSQSDYGGFMHSLKFSCHSSRSYYSHWNQANPKSGTLFGCCYWM